MTAPIPLGEFDLLEPLGRGGMAEVWSAVHRPHGAKVAVKVVTEALARDPGAVAAFREEVRAVARLDHPGVVLVLDCGEVTPEAEAASDGRLVAGSPFLAMELLRGGTLSDRAEGLRWSGVKAILRSLLEALGHAHARGVLHRDIKPTNVLFAGPGARRPGLRLTDFGLARAFAGEGIDAAAALQTSSGIEDQDDVAGSPYYMAPEALAGRTWAEGPWTDLYALGCVAYELVCGRRPFGGADIAGLVFAHLQRPPRPFQPRFQVPAGLARWIAVLLAKDPSRRPPTAAHVLRALDTLGRPAVGRLPLPERWRLEERSHPPSVRLVGAGLRLFGFRRPAVVARDAERDVLWSALRDVVEGGGPRVVLIEGEAGLGKTRLATWVADRAVELGGAERWVLSGRDPTAAHDLDDLVREHLACVDLDPPATRDLLRDRADLDDDDRASLGALLGLEPDEDLTPVRLGGPRERCAVVRRLLARRARRRLVVVVLEDLHRGGDAAHLFEHLGRASPGSIGSVLVVGTVRPEALAEAAPVLIEQARGTRRVRFLTLSPMPRADVVRMLRESPVLDPATAELVASRSGGNPMFATSLVRSWIESGSLRPGRGGFRLSAATAERIPDDVHSVWLERLARLLDPDPDGAQLQCLEVAAALGARVDAFEWSDACRRAGLRADPHLIDRLAARDVVVPTEAGWAFRGDMLRRSLRRSARDEGRERSSHAAAAASLRARLSPHDPAGPRRIGILELRAGELQRAEAHLALGAAHAANRSEHRSVLEQVALRGRALDGLEVPPADPRRLETSIAGARAYLALGRLDDADRAAEKVSGAARGEEAVPVLVAALGIRAEVLRLRGEVDACAALLERGLDLCPVDAPRERAGLLRLLAVHHRRRGETALARRLLDEAARLFEALQDAGELLDVRLAAALVAEADGRFDDAYDGFAALLPAYAARGDRGRRATVLGGLGSVAYAFERWGEAEEHFRASWRLAEAAGLPMAPLAGLNVALTVIRRRRFDDLPDLLEAVGRLMSPRSHRPWLALLEVYRLVAAAAQGDDEGWDRSIEATRAELGVLTGSPEDPAIAAETAGALAERRGRLIRAADAFQLASELYGRLGTAGAGRAAAAKSRARELRSVTDPG